MDYLFVNTQELSALMELPLIQRVAYLMGIRPYMDKQTCIVGIKRKISYQSLREVLYVAPIAGVRTENPNLQQMRRVVKSLERVGLITIQSTEKHLILKCVLAEVDRSVQNKADMRPTPQADMKPTDFQAMKSMDFNKIQPQADRVKTSQADTPHNSEGNYVFLCKQFEKFWECYPQPQNKAHAWSEFKNLNPGAFLFSKILSALNAQINHHQQLQAAGLWVPHWKYPANWLALCCWEDEINTNKLQEKMNASHKARDAKQPTDFFWESCKAGADYVPDCEAIADDSASHTENVIQFHEYRQTSEAH